MGWGGLIGGESEEEWGGGMLPDGGVTGVQRCDETLSSISRAFLTPIHC